MAPKVAALMGLGDYCVIQPNGARVCYGGTDPNATPPPVKFLGPPVPKPYVPPTVFPGFTRGGGNGTAYEYPDGTALKVAGQPAVYLIENGEARWIPDGATLTALGIGWANVITVPAAVLAQYPQGPPLPSQSATSAADIAGATAPPATAAAPATVATPASNYVSANQDGSLLVAPPAAAAIDWASPSTWPSWVWLALSAGAAWLVFFKKK